MLEFDHVAIAAATVEEGVEWVRETLGVDIPQGGKHPLMGTHNHLMQLGNAAFLEVIAIDPDARPERVRWFDLDRFSGPPRIQTWLARCPAMGPALDAVPVDVGGAVDLTRGDLSWQISVRDDGTLPYDGVFPSIIDWPEGQFPIPQMPDRGCALRKLTLEHPAAAELEHDLGEVLRDARIDVVPGQGPWIRAEIETPFGVRLLG